MASINKVILIGNLGADPDVRYTPSGKAVATLSVATNKQFKDKETGEKKERVEWHRCVLWDKTAETAGQYLKKGSQVYLEGELQTRKWEDKDHVQRYTTEIRCYRMQMLGKSEGGGGGGRAPHPADEDEREPATDAEADAATPDDPDFDPGGVDDFEDDIPF